MFLAGRTTITISHRLSTIKDADCIYVMGGGTVLERGKHDELLSNEDGPYARLVAAQGLREVPNEIDVADLVPVGQGSCEKPVESSADIERASMEEVPLGRRDISKSLAGEIIEQREAQSLSNKEKEYSMFYLFKRMGGINRGEWKHYLFGFLFSIGKYLPFFGLSRPLTVGLQLVALCYPLSVLFGVRKMRTASSDGQDANHSVPQIAQAVTGLSDPSPHERRHAGDRNALWWVIFVSDILTITQ